MGIAKRIAALPPRTIFLIDGIGALVTAGLLAGVLGNWEDLFGVPRNEIYLLAGIAGLFALYSFSCAALVREKWRPFLRVIALANLSYCGLTIALVFFALTGVTTLGKLYFVGESLVVCLLVAVEWSKTLIGESHP